MNRRDLMIDLAQDTIGISKKGEYLIGPRKISFSIENNTQIYKEKDFEEIIKNLKEKQIGIEDTNIVVKNEGTVDTIFRLSKNKGFKNLSLGVLNFASAYNPGGGFESGAMAQEECLAYCSDLYLKQTTGKGPEYYQINRSNRQPIYTDTMLMSNVTFFRNSNFMLVAYPVMCSVLTSPAVNMGTVINFKQDEEKAQQIMKTRMRKILYIFALNNCTDLVLGAFGCGVFGNKPEDVACFWKELLFDENLKRFFNTVTFSIVDRPGRDNNVKVFKDILK